MYPSLKLSSAVLQQIRQHGEATFPFECCGFLFGKEASDIRFINITTPVNNSKKGDQRRRFEIAPFDYMKAEQFALANDVQLLGVYHSHPNHPAIASEHDLAVAMPYFSYVIVSVMDGVATNLLSWRINEQADEKQFFQEKIIIEKKFKQTL